MRPFHWLFLVAAISALPAVPARSQPSAPLIEFNGRLTAQSPRDATGRRYQDRRLRLQAGERYRISVMSSRFDTLVQVLLPGGARPIAQDDDSGGGENARLLFVPPETRDYVIRALAFLPTAGSSYFLRVELAQPFPPPLPTQPRPAERTAGTTAWTTYPGSLTEDDSSLDGLRFDDYLVTLAVGEEIIVRLDSTAFDPIVQIYPASEREGQLLAFDDDAGGNRNSLLVFTAAEAGDYVVRATAWGTTRTRPFLGPYQLRIGR